MQKAMARQVNKFVASGGAVDPLAEVLKAMRSDVSDDGFEAQKRLRTENADRVPAAIDALVSNHRPAQFLIQFERDD